MNKFKAWDRAVLYDGNYRRVGHVTSVIDNFITFKQKGRGEVIGPFRYQQLRKITKFMGYKKGDTVKLFSPTVQREVSSEITHLGISYDEKSPFSNYYSVGVVPINENPQDWPESSRGEFDENGRGNIPGILDLRTLNIKLEEGEFYITRKGVTYGPMMLTPAEYQNGVYKLYALGKYSSDDTKVLISRASNVKGGIIIHK